MRAWPVVSLLNKRSLLNGMLVWNERVTAREVLISVWAGMLFDQLVFGLESETWLVRNGYVVSAALQSNPVPHLAGLKSLRWYAQSAHLDTARLDQYF